MSDLRTNPFQVQLSDVDTSDVGKTADYTSIWSATAGVAPALGNGTLTSWYQRNKDTIRVGLHLVMGNTTTFGTAGYWTFTLPFTGVTVFCTGSGYLLDNSTGFYYPVTSILDASETGVASLAVSGNPRVTFNTLPWAVNDIVHFDLEYRIK